MLTLWMKLRVTIQMKPREPHFYAVLFIMLLVVIPTFEIEDQTLVCDHLNESYWTLLSHV